MRLSTRNTPIDFENNEWGLGAWGISFISLHYYSPLLDCTTDHSDLEEALMECTRLTGMHESFRSSTKNCCKNETHVRVYACRTPKDCMSATCPVMGCSATSPNERIIGLSYTYSPLTSKPATVTKEEDPAPTTSPYERIIGLSYTYFPLMSKPAIVTKEEDVTAPYSTQASQRNRFVL